MYENKDNVFLLRAVRRRMRMIHGYERVLLCLRRFCGGLGGGFWREMCMEQYITEKTGIV